MSGTDHSVFLTHTKQPSIILVRPQMGENIGAAARAMWNFGLDRMTLVAPRDGWPNPAATALASGAASVLDHLELSTDVPNATQHLHYTMATTARARDLTKPVLSPKEAMKRAHQYIANGQNVGILFGAERSGLENHELVDADAMISIPVNPAFGSLNLAQAVLLLAYEWRLADGEVVDERVEWASAQPANHAEREALSQTLEQRLDQIGFFWPEEKATSMKLSLRNLFSRMPLTDIDVRTLHGVFRALWRGEKNNHREKNRHQEK